MKSREEIYEQAADLVVAINQKGSRELKKAEVKIEAVRKRNDSDIKGTCDTLKKAYGDVIVGFSYKEVTKRVGMESYDKIMLSKSGQTLDDLEDVIANDAQELTRLLSVMQSSIDDEKKFAKFQNTFTKRVKIITKNISDCATFDASIKKFCETVQAELRAMDDLTRARNKVNV